jgi:hypothetical protein
MKAYLLLRDHKESGPYSLEQLKALKLRPGDLICEEDTSPAWQYAIESDGLKAFVGQRAKVAVQRKNRLSIAAVFIGLLFSIFLLEKIVTSLEEYGFKQSQTAAVVPVTILHEKVADEDYQNALVTEIVPLAGKTKKMFIEAVKPAEIKKQIKLKGSDYSVGYLGGINGLELTVTNNSSHFVNLAEIEVYFLNKRGDVLATETYPVSAMKAHSSQTLSIPSNKTGVKIKYKIVYIYSWQHPSLLKEV